MITCTRRLTFCAGHRVVGHENKCRNLHGHNYVVLVEATAKPGLLELDPVGRVIDFSVLKEKLGGWLDQYWDHGTILWNRDRELLDRLCDFDTKLFELPENPTAENLADYLMDFVCPVLFKGDSVTITKITIWETENCYAEIRR